MLNGLEISSFFYCNAFVICTSMWIDKTLQTSSYHTHTSPNQIFFAIIRCWQITLLMNVFVQKGSCIFHTFSLLSVCRELFPRAIFSTLKKKDRISQIICNRNRVSFFPDWNTKTNIARYSIRHSADVIFSKIDSGDVCARDVSYGDQTI